MTETAPAEPIIDVAGLTRRHRVAPISLFARAGSFTAVDNLSLRVPEGSSLGIIGESGSGKSTLVRLLLGLDVPSEGTITIDGRDVSARAPATSLHWLRRLTGVVFQDPYASLDPRMSVGRIIAEPLWALRIDGDHRARVAETLRAVGLDEGAAHRFPHEFSGGQRQRIALARALVHRPRILVGDEMLSALDVSVRAQILEFIRERRHQDGLTLVFVSHDIGVVQSICDDIAVMTEGRIVEHGPTSRVLRAPEHDYTRRLLSAVPTL